MPQMKKYYYFLNEIEYHQMIEKKEKVCPEDSLDIIK